MEDKYEVGWTIVLIILLNITVNLAVIFTIAIRDRIPEILRMLKDRLSKKNFQ